MRPCAASAPRKSLTTLLYAATALGLVMPAIPALAAAPVAAIEEVLVTARKREESLQETPISIAAFNQQELERRNITNLLDLQLATPGLISTSGAIGGGGGQYFIRGTGQSDWIAAFEPGVGIYVDEIYLGRINGAALDLVDVAQIAVLRGPQGTLFGRNTIGGAISITSAAPSFENEGYIEMTIGEREHLSAKAVVSGPLVEDKLAVRLSARGFTQNGYGKRLVDGKRHGDKELMAARVAFQLRATEDLTIDVAADVTHQTGTNDFSKAIALFQGLYPDTEQYLGTGRNETWNRLLAPNDNDTWGVSLIVKYDLTEDIQIKSITSYRDMETQSGLDFDGVPGPLLEQMVTTDQDQFSQEFQFTGSSFDDRLTWLVGLYYFQEDIEQLTENDITFPGFVVYSPQLNIMDNENYAGFAHATFKITEALRITGGIRYTHEKKSQFYDHSYLHRPGSFLPDGTVQQLVGPVTVSESWNSTTPKASLEYQPLDNLLTYFSYSEGFRSGGFNGRPAFIGAVVPFGPEKVKAWEAGFKSDLWDRRLRVNASVFLNKYTDLQLSTQGVVDGTPAILVGNAGKAKLKGGELEVTAAPAEGLLLNFGLAYLDQKFTELDEGVLVGTGWTLDTRQPNTPEWQVSGGAEYTFNLGNAGSLTARADYSYVSGRTFILGGPLEYQKNENVVNARLTYETPDERWQVSVYGRNLFDDKYNAFMEDALAAFGVALIWPAAPQEFGATVKFNF